VRAWKESLLLGRIWICAWFTSEKAKVACGSSAQSLLRWQMHEHMKRQTAKLDLLKSCPMFLLAEWASPMMKLLWNWLPDIQAKRREWQLEKQNLAPKLQELQDKP
jgi:hypothetical protein